MPRRRRSLAPLAIAAALLAGCAGNTPQAPATAAPAAAPIPAQTTESFSPWAESLASEAASERPTDGPWTPCDAEEALIDPLAWADDPSVCKDLDTDTCDGLYVSKQDSGSVLDTMIENKDSIDEDRLKDCPQFAKDWKKAKAGFDDGEWTVGTEVKAGTYETTAHLSGGKVTDCYWERSGKNGRTIANDLITAAKKVRVAIRSSDEMFTTRGCGDWVPVG